MPRKATCKTTCFSRQPTCKLLKATPWSWPTLSSFSENTSILSASHPLKSTFSLKASKTLLKSPKLNSSKSFNPSNPSSTSAHSISMNYLKNLTMDGNSSLSKKLIKSTMISPAKYLLLSQPTLLLTKSKRQKDSKKRRRERIKLLNLVFKNSKLTCCKMTRLGFLKSAMKTFQESLMRRNSISYWCVQE